MEKSKVVNGFRIIPVEFSTCYCWSVLPNFSTRTFYFSKLSCAESFCHRYFNNHTERFWFRLFVKNPIYHFINVKKSVDSISFLL